MTRWSAYETTIVHPTAKLLATRMNKRIVKTSATFVIRIAFWQTAAAGSNTSVDQCCGSPSVRSSTPRRDHVLPILRSLHWLPVRRRVTFKSAVIAWKRANGVASIYLRELCVPVEDIGGRPRLQSASNRSILLPRVQTSTGQRSFAYSRPAVWNNLPPALRKHYIFNFIHHIIWQHKQTKKQKYNR